MTATTWDPNNKSGNLTLSGGNLTAASASGTSAGAATRKISGNTYCEFTMGSALTGSVTVGLAEPGFNNGVLLGSTNNLTVGYAQSGAVSINGATISTIATFAAGNRVDMAVNPNLQLVWFRVNGGSWNNSGTADPASNSGGISLATMGGINFWPAVSLTAVASQTVTAAFSSASFAGTPPTGYASVDTISLSAEANGAVSSHSASFTQYGPAHSSTVASPSQIAAEMGSHAAPSTFVVVPIAQVLQGGTIGTAYSETISAAGGASPYTFALTGGSLPSGLSLNGSTGVISGTPTLSATSTFTIQATDANGVTGSESFTIAVSAPSSGGASNYGWAA